MHMEKCHDCLVAKQNRVAFCPTPPMRTKNALKLVHTDVCQVDAKSHADAQYFVTFINDYSRKLWAFTLKTKDQVLSVFKEFQARAEREIGHKLKVIQIENEGIIEGRSKNNPSLKVSG